MAIGRDQRGEEVVRVANEVEGWSEKDEKEREKQSFCNRFHCECTLQQDAQGGSSKSKSVWVLHLASRASAPLTEWCSSEKEKSSG